MFVYSYKFFNAKAKIFWHVITDLWINISNARCVYL
jgi:hypothetical protein